jgi:hypothetical protein
MARKFRDTFENIRKKKKKFLCFNFNFSGNYVRVSYVLFNISMLFIILSYNQIYLYEKNNFFNNKTNLNLVKNSTINNNTAITYQNPNLNFLPILIM